MRKWLGQIWYQKCVSVSNCFYFWACAHFCLALSSWYAVSCTLVWSLKRGKYVAQYLGSDIAVVCCYYGVVFIPGFCVMEVCQRNFVTTIFCCCLSRWYDYLKFLPLFLQAFRDQISKNISRGNILVSCMSRSLHIP